MRENKQSKTLVAIVLFLVSCYASADDPLSVAEYLSLNEARREIVFERQLAAQREQYRDCLRASGEAGLREASESWFAHNPQYLNRSLSLATIFALRAVCQPQVNNEETGG